MMCSVGYFSFIPLYFIAIFNTQSHIVSTSKLNIKAETGPPWYILRDIINDLDRYPVFFTLAEEPE